MTRMLAGINGPLVLTQARAGLEGIGQRFDKTEHLVRCIQNSAGINPLVVIEALELCPEFGLR